MQRQQPFGIRDSGTLSDLQGLLSFHSERRRTDNRRGI